MADLPIYKTSKPVQIVPGFADFEHVSNVKLEAGPKETIQDVRGREHEFTLERNGFQYLNSPTGVKDFASKDALETDYLRECERLLRREVSGVDEVVFFDARVSLLLPFVQALLISPSVEMQMREDREAKMGSVRTLSRDKCMSVSGIQQNQQTYLRS